MVQEGYEARKRKAVAQTFTARRNRNGLLDTWGGAFWVLWGGEHDSCQTPDSHAESAETRRVVSLSAR